MNTFRLAEELAKEVTISEKFFQEQEEEEQSSVGEDVTVCQDLERSLCLICNCVGEEHESELREKESYGDKVERLQLEVNLC